MIAKRALPKRFVEWNAREGAPFGRELTYDTWRKRLLPWRMYVKQKGPFFFQPNNTTRMFEYPWAFYATPVAPGHRALEIGGGLSGFQFVLDKCGCTVVNVDPGMEASGKGWRCNPEMMAKFNRWFKTSVELRNTVIPRAELPPCSFDCAYSISVIEHLAPAEIEDTMKGVYAALKPGGHFVLTVDLFINLAPFSTRTRNLYGTNFSVKELIEYAPFELEQGDRSELFGFPEFRSDQILANIESYLLGTYPALAQCMVLRKP